MCFLCTIMINSLDLRVLNEQKIEIYHVVKGYNLNNVSGLELLSYVLRDFTNSCLV